MRRRHLRAARSIGRGASLLATVAVLMLVAAPAGRAADGFAIQEPAPGATVFTAVPQVILRLPPGLPPLTSVWLSVDGVPLAAAGKCFTFSPPPPPTGFPPTFPSFPGGTASCAALFPPKFSDADGDFFRIALHPGLVALPVGTDTRARHVFAPAAGLGTLGYLDRGLHTLTASVLGPQEVGQVIGQATVSFQVGERQLNIVYDNLFAANQILDAEAGLAPLTPNRGGVRQSARTSSSPWGASRLNGTALATQSAPEIADALRRAVDRSCGAVPRRSPPPECGGSGLVTVDEITPAYEDWGAARRAEENRDSPATRLSDALKTLQRRSPWGFSYASRVHLYLSGTVATNIARPRPAGPRFKQLAPSLVRAGGVWIEMYTGSEGSGAVAFSKADWRTVPGAVARLAGGNDGLHFVFTRARRVERAVDASGARCASPMACQWALAESTQINRIILRNGVAAYRTSDQASDWLKEYNRRFRTQLLLAIPAS